MSADKRLKNIAIAIVAIIVIIAAAVSAVYLLRKNRIEQENSRIQAAAQPLEFEKRALERELIDITKPLPGGSVITVAVLDADAEVYTRVWTKFAYASTGEADESLAVSRVKAGEKLLFSGTICLSHEEMPGMEGNITAEELEIMLASGWSTAILVNAERAEELDVYLSDMIMRISALGISDPDTVYFLRGTYDRAAHDGILRAHGIDTVINELNDSADPLTQDLSDDIWRIGAIGWSGTKDNPTAGRALTSLLENHGATVFSLDTWHEPNRGGHSHFVPGVSEASFEKMLFKFLDSVEAGDLQVAGASASREIYENYKTEYDLHKNVYEPRKAEINTRLDEIEKRLKEIYAGEV